MKLARIFYKRIKSGGLNHRLDEGVGCRLNTDLTGSEIGFVSPVPQMLCAGNFKLRALDLRFVLLR